MKDFCSFEIIIILNLNEAFFSNFVYNLVTKNEYFQKKVLRVKKTNNNLTWASENVTKVFVKILGHVLVVHLDLEDREPVHPRNESGESRFTGTGNSNEQKMSLRLPEDSVNPKNVIKNFVEQNQGNVKLFLVEDFEPEIYKN